MAIRRSSGERVFELFNIIGLALLVLVTLYPFYHVVIASISNPTRMMQHQGLLLYPKGFSMGAYIAVLNNPNITSGYLNTLFLVVAGTAINTVMTCLSGFVLSRKTMMWGRLLSFIAVFTMFFSGGMIPLYLQVRALGLTNTLWALILPSAISTYNTIILRTAFYAIPESLEESARIDGCKDHTVLIRILIPLIVPTLAVIILFYGVGHWNSWFSAMLYLRERSLYPLQLILREILIASSTDSMMVGTAVVDRELIGETIKYATIIVATVPILVVYPFMQRYFVQGMMIGAVKG